MTQGSFGPVVSTAWLAAALGAPDLKVVDGSWYLPAERRDPAAEHRAARIPGAVFFDIDAIADKQSALPHMLPRAAAFAEAVGALGISSGDRVVAYDGAGQLGASRVWWTFRVFGHERVAVLDGGLPKWRAEGHRVAAGVERPRPARYVAREKNPDLVRSFEQVRANLDTGAEQLLDLRSAGRFHGTEPEPRQGLRSGHIPGSHNLPLPEVLDPVSKTFLPPERLRAAFARAGLDPSRPVVTSCGSGIAACVAKVALELAGFERVAVYDGSWTEWGGRADSPIET